MCAAGCTACDTACQCEAVLRLLTYSADSDCRDAEELGVGVLHVADVVCVYASLGVGLRCSQLQQCLERMLRLVPFVCY